MANVMELKIASLANKTARFPENVRRTMDVILGNFQGVLDARAKRMYVRKNPNAVMLFGTRRVCWRVEKPMFRTVDLNPVVCPPLKRDAKGANANPVFATLTPGVVIFRGITPA